LLNTLSVLNILNILEQYILQISTDFGLYFIKEILIYRVRMSQILEEKVVDGLMEWIFVACGLTCSAELILSSLNRIMEGGIWIAMA
jgi:hypothetical protein